MSAASFSTKVVDGNNEVVVGKVFRAGDHDTMTTHDSPLVESVPDLPTPHENYNVEHAWAASNLVRINFIALMSVFVASDKDDQVNRSPPPPPSAQKPKFEI